MNEGIGLRIKELRKEKKLTQVEFSNEIGIDNSQLSKIEQGKIMPTLIQLMEIASKFNISLDWITGFSETSKKIIIDVRENEQGNIEDLNEKQLMEKLNALEQKIDHISNEKLKLIENKIIAGVLSTNKFLQVVLLQLDVDEKILKNINDLGIGDEFRESIR
ncbi:helix-turn-helix transcriptional regulator [Elizabethkingia ursingii]|uniref:helix-turn-helix domain-containing protein n=1 Tax=Elizabethkingia ursingii TaxID=1756150 RepID=UPI0020128F58|nr:helix-turn-helix transcriptional regulator [Elizabethkingia ursingii]MCL1664076.1 helix-turn-helix transcriptional regulator [Elizabethkingia ursingii]